MLILNNIGLSGYTGPITVFDQKKDQKYIYYTLFVENKILFETYYLKQVWNNMKNEVFYIGPNNNEVKVLLSELKELLDISKKLWKINTIEKRNYFNC